VRAAAAWLAGRLAGWLAGAGAVVLVLWAGLWPGKLAAGPTSPAKLQNPAGNRRFAQFFICPLISGDGVDREINAVESEHGKNINTDAWRTYQWVAGA
jgi:hypothetical protein